MRDFEFQKASSLSQAVAALRQAPEAKLLAGGQSLLPVMKMNLAAPSHLISISGLPELQGIRRQGDSLIVGAGVTHSSVAASPEVRSALPSLAALAELIGDPQVRNRGTLGGSVAHADPAADYPAALLALNATIVTDRRELPADSFFKGMFETALGRDEIVTAVKFPTAQRAAYVKFPHPASKYAIVGVMVAKSGAGVRVAVTGASPCVYRHQAAEQALSKNLSTSALRGITTPQDGLLSDLHASAEYRAHLVGVMTQRAVAALA
jgi:aerobic carbon-monoxide dehydrogenase medium subunit